MTDHAGRGDTALGAGHFQEAIGHFSKALEQNSSATTWLIKRSTAYQRASKYTEALQDADAAVLSANKRQNRELIASAQLRRAIALFGLNRFGDAQFLLDIVEQMDGKIKSVQLWKAQVASKLGTLPPDDPKAIVSVEKNPKPVFESTKEAIEKAGPAPQTSIAAARTPADKVKYTWYQNRETVTVDILAKGVPEKSVSIDVGRESITVSFPTSLDSTFDLTIDPLYAEVDDKNVSKRFSSTKIAIQVRKVDASQTWRSLEKSEDKSSLTLGASVNSQPVAQAKGPAYPTSSRSGPKNWDQIAKSYNKPKQSDKDDEGAQSDRQGDRSDAVYVDDNEDDVGDPTNAFFSRLFAGADPDTRRAMMKSYQESGGTALSTNWSEVSKGRVPVTPPEGMEERKYER